MSSNTTQKIDKEAAIAKAAQDAKRKSAPPNIKVSSQPVGPLKKLVALYAPECLPAFKVIKGKRVQVDPSHHDYWDEKINHENNVTEGYEPVKKPSGAYVDYREVRLYRIPYDLHLMDLKQAIDISNSHVSDKVGKKVKKAAADGSPVDTEEVVEAGTYQLPSSSD